MKHFVKNCVKCTLLTFVLVLCLSSVNGLLAEAADYDHLVVIANSASNLVYTTPNVTAAKTVMDIRGGIRRGEFVILWIAKDYSLPSTNNQAFNLIPGANEEYFQISAHPGFDDSVFAPVSSNANLGARLIMAEPNATDETQWWKLQRQSNGHFIFVNKTNTELCIAPTSVFQVGDPHNYLTLQPLNAANNTWIIEVMEGTVILERPIESIESIDNITVTEGASINNIELPQSIEVTINGLLPRKLPVNWNTLDFNGDTPGTYILTGALQLDGFITNPLNLFASVSVTVERNKFAVTFVNWDGTVIDEQIIEHGNFIASVPTPNEDKPGEEFLYWYYVDSSSKEVEITDFTTFAIVGDTTIYAKYGTVELPTVYVTGPALLDVDDTTATYTFSVERIWQNISINAVSIKVSFDAEYFDPDSTNSDTVGIGLWDIHNLPPYGTDWILNGGKFERTFLLTYPGENAEKSFDFLEIILESTDVAGTVEVEILDATIANVGREYTVPDIYIAPAIVETVIVKFSRFDVNRDRVINLADAAAAAYFFMYERWVDSTVMPIEDRVENTYWADDYLFAKDLLGNSGDIIYIKPMWADVNRDGVVDIEDFLQILIHFT